MGQHRRGGLLLGALLCGLLPAVVSAQAADRKPSSPDDAMNQFMQAVADSNLTRMAQLWGTKNGSAAKTRRPNEFQKRVFLMHSFLKGGTVRIANSVPDPEVKGQQQMLLDFRRGDCQRTVPASAVLTKNEGWLVNNIDISTVGVPGRSCGTPGDTATPEATPEPAPAQNPG